MTKPDEAPAPSSIAGRWEDAEVDVHAGPSDEPQHPPQPIEEPRSGVSARDVYPKA